MYIGWGDSNAHDGDEDMLVVAVQSSSSSCPSARVVGRSFPRVSGGPFAVLSNLLIEEAAEAWSC